MCRISRIVLGAVGTVVAAASMASAQSIQSVGMLPGSTNGSFAYGVSGDGNVVVGTSGTRAFR
jgi:uncharacterized membrane protein